RPRCVPRPRLRCRSWTTYTKTPGHARGRNAAHRHDKYDCSTRAMVGTSPAVEMRLGSSKDADIAVGLCNNCTCEVPFWAVELNSRQALFFLPRRAFPIFPRRYT
ncbi:hypothetical protein HMPREF0290_0438, partial [Corynebacterium efficiens YS-314]